MDRELEIILEQTIETAYRTGYEQAMKDFGLKVSDAK